MRAYHRGTGRVHGRRGHDAHVTISATAPTSAKATKLTRAATTAFLAEVRSRQHAAKIPVKDRIQLRVVKAADEPKLVKPRSKSVPILVLLGGLIATVAVAFTRDNVARRETAPVLTAASPDETSDPDLAVGASHARSTLEPVPRRDTATAREDPGSSIGVTRGRALLGPLPARTRSRAKAFPTTLPSRVVGARSASS